MFLEIGQSIKIFFIMNPRRDRSHREYIYDCAWLRIIVRLWSENNSFSNLKSLHKPPQNVYIYLLSLVIIDGMSKKKNTRETDSGAFRINFLSWVWWKIKTKTEGKLGITSIRSFTEEQDTNSKRIFYRLNFKPGITVHQFVGEKKEMFLQ